MMRSKGKGRSFTHLCFRSSLGILVLLISACGSPAPAVLPPTPSASPPTATQLPPTATLPPTAAELPPTATLPPPTPALQSNGCLQSTASAAAYTNNQDAYCLLVPNDFSISQPAEGLLVIAGPALDDSLQPVRAMLTIARVGSSGGRALAELSQEAWSGARQPFSESTVTLGGDPAIAAEGLLIGEAEWKVSEVMVVHAGMLYRLTFTPVDESQPFAQALPHIQTLWEHVFASLVFLF